MADQMLRDTEVTSTLPLYVTQTDRHLARRANCRKYLFHYAIQIYFRPSSGSGARTEPAHAGAQVALRV
ncbi:hypothetical protein EVAR_61503_1 [Eumeta japonica]|uniref:Uncharacterized protein n=1 Tax=Eumeta variegata TaxID=151549 RepID=A0A4C2A498_EUMVA|nr:hypothetical protein EVAR_61503_1 [Eumeta japonica]